MGCLQLQFSRLLRRIFEVNQFIPGFTEVQRISTPEMSTYTMLPIHLIRLKSAFIDDLQSEHLIIPHDKSSIKVECLLHERLLNRKQNTTLPEIHQNTHNMYKNIFSFGELSLLLSRCLHAERYSRVLINCENYQT